MSSNIFRFNESWEIPNATAAQVYDVLAHGELLPLWWKGVYLEAEKLTPEMKPKVGTASVHGPGASCPIS